MNLLKKDWMYDVKSIGIVLGTFFIGLVGVIILVLSPRYSLTREILKQIFDKLYTILTLMLTLYPMCAFKPVCPQIGSDKIYISTANLPFSRKQIFFKGLKPWLIIFPIYILAGAAVVAVLSNKTETFGLLYLFALIRPAVIILFMFIFHLQVISAIIFSLTKRIRWYKIVPAVILSNVALGVVCTLVMFALDINTVQNFNWSLGVVLAYILTSLTVFVIAWRDVEKVYR